MFVYSRCSSHISSVELFLIDSMTAAAEVVFFYLRSRILLKFSHYLLNFCIFFVPLSLFFCEGLICECLNPLGSVRPNNKSHFAEKYLASRTPSNQTPSTSVSPDHIVPFGPRCARIVSSLGPSASSRSAAAPSPSQPRACATSQATRTSRCPP